MGRISSGINATSGSASLGSAVYFVCRHMLYGHRHPPGIISTLATWNNRYYTARVGRSPLSGDGLAQAFEQTFELRHPLAQLADLLARLLALGVDALTKLLTLSVDAFDALVDVIAEQPHLASQASERGGDRDEDRDRGADDGPRGGVHIGILPALVLTSSSPRLPGSASVSRRARSPVTAPAAQRSSAPCCPAAASSVAGEVSKVEPYGL